MGAFGSFSLGPPTSQSGTTEKRPGYGSVRGESRFKGLLSKESSEDVNALARDKGATRSTTESGERAQSPWGETLKTRPSRSETNPFGEEPRAGSAALGGSQEAGSAHQGADDLGFGAFGMTPGVAGIRDLLQSRDSHDVPSHLQGLEPTSPTNTNPYQSPRGDKGGDDDVETDGSDVQRTQIPGLRALREDANAASFGGIRHAGSGLDLSAGDRSQTSSAGPGKNFPSLGGLGSVPGLGNVSGWPSSGAIGTPTRERAAFSGFGETAFSTAADMQSPTVSTLGGGGFFGSHGGLTGTGSIGRSSKMGSLFPPSMQEQMHGDAHQDASAQQGELWCSATWSRKAALITTDQQSKPSRLRLLQLASIPLLLPLVYRRRRRRLATRSASLSLALVQCQWHNNVPWSCLTGCDGSIVILRAIFRALGPAWKCTIGSRPASSRLICK